MKAKFDSVQIKSFFLHHVEKIVFGGFILAFVMICSAAFKQKPYEKKPAELKALADRISQEVDAKTPPDKFADLPGVPNFSNLGAVGPALVNAHFFAVDPLSLPYELRQERRKEPKFFALLEPMAFPGYGGIAINEAGGVARLAGGMGTGMDGMSPTDQGPAMGPIGPGMEEYARMEQERMRMNTAAGATPPAGMGAMMGPMGPAGGARARAQAARERRKEKRKGEVAKPTAPPPKPQITEKIVITQPPSGSHVEGRYWVCLVGAIPYAKQFTEYQNTFRDARSYDPRRDVPRYELPQIERAEVTDDGELDWEEVDVEEAVDDLAKWAADYPDVVDKKFLDPWLTEPLPPLIFANHDKEKVNHPLTKVAEQKPVVEAEDPSKKKVRRALTGQVGAGRGNQPGMMPGGSQAMMPGYGGGMGADPYGGYGGAGMPGMGGAGRQMAPLVEHRLFRFFDFSVKPGKKYQYRIKLVLKNPNSGIPPRFLDNYAYREGATREAEWSKPSPPVTVIAGNRLLAGGVSVTPGKGGEPAGKVLAKLFDAEEAAEVRKVFDVSRGSVLNEHEAKIGLSDSASGRPVKREAKVNIETNAVVLDMFGGEKIPNAKSSKIPGHILVLDNDGEIRALLQASDAGVFETEEAEAKNQAPPTEEELKQQKPQGAGGFDNFDAIEDKPRRGRSR